MIALRGQMLARSLWICERKSGVPEKDVKVVQDMYEEVCSRSDRWDEGGGGIASGSCSDPRLVSSGDGKADR